MEEFEHPMLFIQLHQRSDSYVRKAAIGLGGQFAKAFRREAVADEGLHHARGQFSIGKSAHSVDVFGAEPRPALRHVEAAIAS